MCSFRFSDLHAERKILSGVVRVHKFRKLYVCIWRAHIVIATPMILFANHTRACIKRETRKFLLINCILRSQQLFCLFHIFFRRAYKRVFC